MGRSFASASSQWLDTASPPVTAMPFSVSALVNPDNITADMCVFCLSDTTAGLNNQWRLVLDGAGGADNVEAVSGTAAAITSGTFGNGFYQQVSAVFASSTDRRVWLNGTSKGTNATSSSPPVPNAMQIGRRASNNTSDLYLDGDVCEVGLWNVALTDDEMFELGAFVSPLFVRPESLVGYWPLIGRDSPEPCRLGSANLTVNGSAPAAKHAGMRGYPAGFGLGRGVLPASPGMVREILRQRSLHAYDWRGERA